MNLSVQGHVGSGTLGLETRNNFLTLISRRKNLRARRRNLSPKCQAVAASDVAKILSLDEKLMAAIKQQDATTSMRIIQAALSS